MVTAFWFTCVCIPRGTASALAPSSSTNLPRPRRWKRGFGYPWDDSSAPRSIVQHYDGCWWPTKMLSRRCPTRQDATVQSMELRFHTYVRKIDDRCCALEACKPTLCIHVVPVFGKELTITSVLLSVMLRNTSAVSGLNQVGVGSPW
jgi:hypothetical protein